MEYDSNICPGLGGYETAVLFHPKANAASDHAHSAENFYSTSIWGTPHKRAHLKRFLVVVELYNSILMYYSQVTCGKN